MSKKNNAAQYSEQYLTAKHMLGSWHTHGKSLTLKASRGIKCHIPGLIVYGTSVVVSHYRLKKKGTEFLKTELAKLSLEQVRAICNTVENDMPSKKNAQTYFDYVNGFYDNKSYTTYTGKLPDLYKYMKQMHHYDTLYRQRMGEGYQNIYSQLNESQRLALYKLAQHLKVHQPLSGKLIQKKSVNTILCPSEIRDEFQRLQQRQRILEERLEGLQTKHQKLVLENPGKDHLKRSSKEISKVEDRLHAILEQMPIYAEADQSVRHLRHLELPKVCLKEIPQKKNLSKERTNKKDALQEPLLGS